MQNQEVEYEPYELEIEQRMLDHGTGFNLGRDGDTKQGTYLVERIVHRKISDALPELEKAIKEDLVPKARRGRRSILHTWYRARSEKLPTDCHLSPKQIAFLTLRVLINAASEEQSKTSIVNQLGQLLELEWNLLAERHGPKFHGSTVRKKPTKKGLNWNPSFSDVQRQLERMSEQMEQFLPSEAPTDLKPIKVAGKLVHLALHITDLFEQVRREQVFVRFNDETQDDTAEHHAALLALAPPRLQAMAVPPRPWSRNQRGGYYSPGLRLPLISISPDKNFVGYHRKAFRNASMPEVFSALNHLQSVRWIIDKRLIGPMTDVFRDLERLRKQLRPPERKQRGSAVPQMRKYDDTRRQLGNLAAALNVAKLYETRSKQDLYFVWTLDWRGRAYPHGGHLHPQGHDTARALLTFGDAKPLGASGETWLALHGASLLGAPSKSMDERAAWVEQPEIQERIREIAKYPSKTLGLWAVEGRGEEETWRKSAWQTLAFCIEWMELKDKGLRKFESRIPVAMDGSCNAIQHLAAMVKDRQLGRLVNLTSNSEPQDVYGLVANLARDQFLSRQEDFPELAKFFKANAIDAKKFFTRQLCKKPVMTIPYGAKRKGLLNQITEALFEDVDPQITSALIRTGFDDTAKAERKQLYNELVELVQISNKQAVAPILPAMKWLQDVARQAASGESALPLQWTTPLGFPVVQANRKRKPKKIDLELTGVSSAFRRFQMTIYEATNEWSPNSSANGIVANFVHSYDAAHMMATVNAAKQAGINNLRMIHDSYATHASDAEDLALLLRKSFINVYQADPLDAFASENEAIFTFARKPIERTYSKRGTLDLFSVLDSQYFFH